MTQKGKIRRQYQVGTVRNADDSTLSYVPYMRARKDSLLSTWGQWQALNVLGYPTAAQAEAHIDRFHALDHLRYRYKPQPWRGP